MKLLTKSSVIALAVLMFSFMNVATAIEECTGTVVTACTNITDQSKCASSYMARTDGTGNQCKWNTASSYCYAYAIGGGPSCGTPNMVCDHGSTYKNGQCVCPKDGSKEQERCEAYYNAGNIKH